MSMHRVTKLPRTDDTTHVKRILNEHLVRSSNHTTQDIPVNSSGSPASNSENDPHSCTHIRHETPAHGDSFEGGRRGRDGYVEICCAVACVCALYAER